MHLISNKCTSLLGVFWQIIFFWLIPRTLQSRHWSAVQKREQKMAWTHPCALMGCSTDWGRKEWVPFTLTSSDWMKYYHLRNDPDPISRIHAPFTQAACLGMSITAHLLLQIWEEYFAPASSFLILVIYHIWCTIFLQSCKIPWWLTPYENLNRREQDNRNVLPADTGLWLVFRDLSRILLCT